uniref:G-protein coupled receptors family 1 profile domain-containing protein n=1 Tax=Panagrolaimus sp. PS1159 TaxID=55785 RepID=A0AC35GH99_9BILA
MDSISEEIIQETFANSCSSQPHVQQHDPDQQNAINIVWWTNVVCLPTIALIGLTCNLLNLLILTSNKSARRIPSWHLLVALAVFDSIFLIFATIEVTPMSIHSLVSSVAFNAFYTHIALFVRTFASTFYKASVLIVVAFNVERYVYVCHPLAAHRFCTSRRSKQAIWISFIISFICSIQWPIVYKIIECWDSHRQHSYYLIVITDNTFLQGYYKLMDYFSLFGFNVAPIILLCWLNCKLIATLRQVVDQDLNRLNNNTIFDSSTMTEQAIIDSNQQRLNANAMLFAVVALLFVCVGPQAPARLLYEYYGHYHSTAVIYTCISQQMVFLNAALNFCLYCLVSRRYRGLLKESLNHVFGSENDLFMSTGIQLKTKFTSLQSPSLITAEESHPILERRASAFH